MDGALLLELFTREGVGTMVSQDPLEQLRAATIDDVGSVLQLIEPLEADGTLVKRSRELLEIEIGRFLVLEHDRRIVGCAALYPFADDSAGELACLAVHPEYRNAGAGERCCAAWRARHGGSSIDAVVRAHHARHALVHRARLRGSRRGSICPPPSRRSTTISAAPKFWSRHCKREH